MISKKDFIADRSFLEKTIPTSRRYSDIGPIVKTGNYKSQSCLLKSLQIKQIHEKKLENEYFSRLKPLEFAKLVYETHFTHDLAHLESILFSTSTSLPSSYPPPSTPRYHDAVSPLMVDPSPSSSSSPFSFSQTTSFPMKTTKWNGSIPTGYDSTLPYLLLDVREESDWKQCHLIAALSYPSPLLKRDQFNRDVIMFKNKKEKSIILYDQDESIAAITAQLLVEKGFENIFILTGGLNALLRKFQGLVIGYPPPPARSVLPKLPTPSLCSTTLPSSLSYPLRFDAEALERSIANATTAASSSRSSSRLSHRTSFSSSSPTPSFAPSTLSSKSRLLSSSSSFSPMAYSGRTTGRSRLSK